MIIQTHKHYKKILGGKSSKEYANNNKGIQWFITKPSNFETNDI